MKQEKSDRWTVTECCIDGKMVTHGIFPGLVEAQAYIDSVKQQRKNVAKLIAGQDTVEGKVD